jgi:hypothetical protein
LWRGSNGSIIAHNSSDTNCLGILHLRRTFNVHRNRRTLFLK